MTDLLLPSDPCVSVIIPYYRGQRFTDTICQSLLCQNEQSFKIIIVDDGRGDGVEELINSLCAYGLIGKAVFVSTFRSRGAAEARNLGLSLVETEFVAFFDVDDIWNENYLSLMISFMRAGRYAISTCEFSYRSNSKSFTKVKLPRLLKYTDLLQTNPLATPAVIINRSIVGNFSFPVCGHEDYGLWLLLTKKNFKIYVLKDDLVLVNRTSGSLSAKKSKAIYWHYKVLRDIADVSRFQVIFFILSYFINAALKRSLPIYRPIFIWSLLFDRG